MNIKCKLLLPCALTFLLAPLSALAESEIEPIKMSQGELDVRAVAAYAGLNLEQYGAVKNLSVADSYLLAEMGVTDIESHSAMIQFKELIKQNIQPSDVLQEEVFELMQTVNLEFSNYSGIELNRLDDVVSRLMKIEKEIETLDKLKLELSTSENPNIVPPSSDSSDDDTTVVTIILEEEKLEESTSGSNINTTLTVYAAWSGIGFEPIRVIYIGSGSGNYLGSQHWVARIGYAYPTSSLYFNGSDYYLAPSP